jgi:hypothetical protein
LTYLSEETETGTKEDSCLRMREMGQKFVVGFSVHARVLDINTNGTLKYTDRL